jgi:hypothetical protein
MRGDVKLHVTFRTLLGETVYFLMTVVLHIYYWRAK